MGNVGPSGAGQPTMNRPFGVPQTPQPHMPPPFRQGNNPGGPMNMPNMGIVQTPNPAWGNQLGPASMSPEKASMPSGKNAGKQLEKRGKKKRRVPIWARVLIGILLFFVVLTGTGYAYYQINFASAVNSMTGKSFTRVKGSEDPNQGKTGSILNWGRINILLLGSDTDDKGNWAGNRYLAQTVIVVTIDTTTHDVGMLSIPRDFWIPIPGYAYHDKLDTAFAYGGSVNNNMSGVGEVVATLDQDFGIPINFYAWVGLDGFTRVIDTVGGVDVDVMHPIVDDTYPDDVNNKSGDQFAYKRLYIPDGPQHLDGETALSYVRSRHSTTDFNRSARQQEVLSALKLKLENPAVLGELPQIAKDLQGYVYTSFKSDQIFDLMNFARGIDSNKIRHLTLGPPYSYGKTEGSSDVVIPKCSLIVPAINQFLHITTGKCDIGNVGQSSSNSPQLASAQFQPAPLAATNVPSTSQFADASLPTTDSLSDILGLRDLLDLMSCVVLDSPQL
jgi:LCP family protein required for cell wall assembly